MQASTDMGHLKDYSTMRRKWLPSCTLMGLMIMCIANTRVVVADGQVGTPTANLFCVSDCGTCPVICSQPPSTQPSKPPPSPPVHQESPPSSPLPLLTPLAPPLSALPPPAQSPPSRPPPPPSHSSKDNAPPPPPPPSKSNNSPNSVPSPAITVVGQPNYNYPYYYFYASDSKASSLCFDKGVSLLAIFLFLHAMCFH